MLFFFFSSRRRHTRSKRDWSSDVCSSDLDPHAGIYDALTAILDGMCERGLTGARAARFELRLLADLGFGLDLDRCAVSGEAVDLVYVSPKSGRAVSRVAGAPWQDKLLRLPPFLAEQEPSAAPSPEELADG